MSALKRMNKVSMHLENKSVSKKFFWMLWIMYAVVYMTKSCYSAAMASIVHEGVLTKSQTGLITAAFYFVYAPLQILGGVFADKYNPEKMIEIGLIGSGIANLIIFLNQNYYVMLYAWIFNAIVQFALWPALFKIISSQLEMEYRIKGVYYITLSSIVGLLMSYVVAAIVPQWQMNFAVSAMGLFLFSFIFHMACGKVEKYMVPDLQDKQKGTRSEKSKIPTWKMFWLSGFLLLVVVAAMRTMVENGVKTISATMLMESYEHISPSIGNILNTLIIVSGVVGVAIINRFVYPRFIRDEAVATLVLVGISVLPIGLMTLLGQAPVFLILTSLCVAAAILSGINLIMSRCSASFAKYGKSGLASGVSNSAASVAIMVQSYGIAYVADVSGWNTVIWLFLALLGIGILCGGIAIPLWKRFKMNKL